VYCAAGSHRCKIGFMEADPGVAPLAEI
jgi:hypothetical protein